jgi:acyl transferase domain-containing protein/acyl-CoA synthetase (AMP-forming)/AMP-acid ligase II/acyl carrier protein/ubiquinone/menaquinone biosynthesis C-methylase UbiE
MKSPKNDREIESLLAQSSFLPFCRGFPEKRLFTCPKETDNPRFLTGKTLEDKIKIFGGFLQQKLGAREKALLLLPQGLEYICGLLACFYANVIAIPTSITSPEQQEQISEKITPILKNSEAACIITDTYFRHYLQSIRFDSVPIFNIDEVEETASANWEERAHTPQDIAILLYTSGSTSQPKGVMISYRNLFSQALTGAWQWDMTEASRIVSWMPQFHNFGLFFNILAPLLSGASSVILAPNGFLKNPENWLATIHQYQATHTAAPNFAFDYCCSSINPDAFSPEFSLGSLQAIVCGGEPVRKETYQNFIGKFQCRGLDPNAFCPHYGLSEVGSVTTKRPGEPLRFLSLDIPSLELGKIKFTNRKTKSKSVTSCGVIAAGTEVLIVDPETGAPCSPEEIGEIRVKSASVAIGYYHQEEESGKTFLGGFLHTGDLGFIDDNHLYIVGREKEVIIIHGKNHHPVDIEWTIKKRIPALSLPLTVFSVEINNSEKVIVVQELETPMSEPEYKKLCREILNAVSENHELEISEINLVKNGSIPRTGSGKIQRKNCRNAYLKQELPLLYQYRQGTFSTKSRHDEPAPEKSQKILEILKREVFQPLLKADLSNIETVTSFSELGLDSIQYVRISRQIEAVFKIQFIPVMLFKHHSFEKLAEYLATQVTQAPISTDHAMQTNSGVNVNRSQNMKKEIAIIGVSCHFPGGATDLETFWENLAGQKDSITTITESRPRIISDDQDYYIDSKGSFPEWGGFIEDIDTFDASFFYISPLEAESMDPQQRKILELTWSVLEDSGYNPERLSGTNTGMFIGVHNNDYAELISRQPSLMDIYGANLDSGLHMSMIAHRASRWFDFHGPSEVINTACSSSLVALHHAVESIQHGECNLAIAGGINLIFASRVYRCSHDAGMLSKDGRCKTFDQAADGFVRAEGYGAVFLKPLEQAIQDRDKIYGVIKKVVINHDGKSNSLRAPNLNAQKELIKAAYRDPDLPPESISYIEVHGTGTSLGDPIEFQALKEAFQEINPDLPEGYCGLGTVKTNIGHCESASGIAGLIKVLSAMKHCALPGLLHFKQLNPYIELSKSPFYIVTQTKEWRRLKSPLGQEIPNRAGISSFGFGGANVHVVVEEYLPLDSASHDSRALARARGIIIDRTAPAIIPISAKNKECLQARVQQLRKFLLKSAAEESDPKAHSERIKLSELAFVLQTGRLAMEERIVFIVKDIPELVRGLAAYETGAESIQDCWHGHIKQNKDLFENDDDVQELIHNWIAKRKLDKIAIFWVQGGTLNWDLLYTKAKPRRINLPTYPFAKKRYWVPGSSNQSLMPGLRKGLENFGKRNSLLGRIVPKETIRLDSGIVLETILTPGHSLVNSHIVQGQAILPALAYIEMIRAALNEVEGSAFVEGGAVMEIEEINCPQPLVITGDISIHIELKAINKHQYAFRIQHPGLEPVLYSQGKIKVREEAEEEYIDYQALQSTGILKKNTKELYERFSKLGIEYKGAFCSVRAMWVNGTEVLGELILNESQSEDEYGCHPGLLESALQTRIELTKGLTGIELVTNMKGVKINSNTPSRVFSYLRRSIGNEYYQLVLVDPSGKVIIQIEQLSTGRFENRLKDLLCLPVWEEQPFVAPANLDKSNIVLIVYSEQSAKFEKTIQDYYRKNKITETILQIELSHQTKPVSGKKWLCNIDDLDGFATCLQGFDTIDCLFFSADCRIENPPLDLSALADSQRNNEIQLLRLMKVLQQKIPSSQTVDCYIITQDNYRITDNHVNPYGGGITGLAYSIAQGDHRFSVRNIDIAAEDLASPSNREALFKLILAEKPSARGEVVKLQSGSRYRQAFLKFVPDIRKIETGLRKGGVYVIVGGSGTVGGVITRYLIQAYQAKVVWIGRKSGTSEAVRKKIESLSEFGEPPQYIQADVTDLEQMKQAAAVIKSQYSTINGAIFSGLVFPFENSLKKTTENQFLDIFNVKSKGSINFYTVFQDEPLDFMCYFSSAQAFSFSGAANLSTYAASITFSDTFIRFIRERSRFPVGSINWGFWRASEGNTPSGNIAFLEDNEGIECFEHFVRLLETGALHLAVCFKVSEPTRELMNWKEDEVVSISEKSSDSLVSSLWNSDFTVKSKIETLIENTSQTRMDEWIVKLTFTQLRRLGLFARTGNQNGIPEEFIAICIKAGIINKYQRWMEECLRILETNGYVRVDREQIDRVYVHVLENPESVDKEQVWRDWDLVKESYLKDVNWKTQVRLVDTCLRKLPEILRGEIPATDIIFPDSSMIMVEEVYKNNVLADYFNEIVATIAGAYVRQRLEAAPETKVRIIEAGAGTGGTSVTVFAKLKPYADHIEYCYTDISKAFLLFAEDKYGPDYPYLTYQIWNVEKPLAEQGIEAGAYDLVIGANVLHATSNIRETVHNAKAALKTNGILIVNEIVQKNIVETMTFGLLDGWWLYQDAYLRIPGSPLLNVDTWRKVLSEAGFRGIQFPAETMRQFGQQVIIAESDGIVRQKTKHIFVRKEKDDTGAGLMIPEEKNVNQFMLSQEPSNPTSQRSIAKVSSMAPLEVSTESLEELVQNMVLVQLAKSLRVSRESIDNDAAFSDYGVDSVIGVSFVKQVNDGLGVSLNTAVIFDYTTVNRLTDYIIKTYREQIQKQLALSSKLLSPQKIVKSIDGLFKVDARNVAESYHNTSNKMDDKHRKLKDGEISRDEAKLLLNALKTQRDSFIQSPQQRNHIEATEATTIRSKSADIAVIGMSGQFPDAPDIDTFWQNLMQGHDAIHDLPAHYCDQSQNMSSKNKMNLRGGILAERDCFDPLFFNISPREAESMSPHQRLILQESWKALEDAGYNPRKLADSQVGIFIGAEPTGYFYESFTGASDAIIASRLSYFLDLKGAAIVVNTGCSSSGTAIHLACESLRNGESVVTIAGGVYASLSQSSLTPLADIGMLSPTGRCCAFDESANGTVLSEGIGIVVLKRLGDAISDGDHIYGVIRGTGINQDGASNGITAPNGTAQEQLISSVYKQFGVNPEEITYIEAHGTGTKLGDPVELNALVRAYKQFTNKAHYCIIGCAKPHIGHTAAASSVIGVIKVLLSMQNHQIPGLINFRKLNPLIELEDSAFYVNTSPVEWRSQNDKPLMAALNSFGHSGTNVHIVIQEYISPDETFSNQIRPNEGPVLIPISAKNKEQLKEYVNNLLKYVKNSNVNLTALAYTLQVGREAMEERIVFFIHDVSELISKLETFLADTEEIANCWRGQVKQGKNTIRLFATDEDMQEAIEKWIYKGKLRKIAETWTQGLEFDWNRLYGEIKPPRISLPTYPFAKERYWLPVRAYHDMPQRATIHPLLHQNTSDLSEQRYSSTFTGREFFLKDHVIMGQRVLPGVAYLEMARAAVAAALNVMAFNTDATNATTFDAASAGSSKESNTMIRIRNVVWAQPIVVDEEPVQVHIGINPEENGEITYEVYSITDTDEAEAVVYSQGRAALVENREIPVLDLQAIRAECSQRNLSAAEVYDFYKAIGVEYGPGHRGIEQIYAGQGRVIAKLSLPDSIAETEEQYVLHPSIMDAALQAAIGMVAGDGNTFLTKPSLPFALQELEVYNRCTRNMWAVIEYSKCNMASDKLRKLDIDLCDEQGQVSVRMQGFSSRTLENGIAAAGAASARARACRIMLEPVWQEQAASNPEANSRARARKVPEYTQQLVILCEPGEITLESIENELNGVRVLNLQTKQKGIEKRFQTYAVRIFEEIQKILAEKSVGKSLVHVVVSRREEQQLFAGLSGILKTAGLENPKVIGQLIELEAMEGPEGLIAKLKENAHTGASYRPMDNMVRYQGGKRLALGWNEVTVASETAEIPWKDGGVYLITGGAGGLGKIFAKEIAVQVKDVTLVLTGRSSYDENKQAGLKELEKNGAKVIYRQVDVTDRKAVNELVGSIGTEFGKLDGIIHSAGIIRDNYILKKTKEELMEVLAPKVAGLVNLDMATQDLSMDFLILFSSTSGIFGNPGQADYATANAFMDAYAKYRNDLVNSGKRKGRTLSINWPLWQEGGMKVDKIVEEMMKQQTGMVAMRTSTGIRALYQALASSKDQVMIIEGELAKIRERLLATSSQVQTQPKQAPVTIVASEALHEKTIYQLKALFGEVTKLATDRIENDEPLESYGIDSIMIIQLNQKLAGFFGAAGRELSKTIFYEYQTLGALAKYLVAEYPQECMKWTGIGEEIQTSAEVSGKAIPLDDGFPVLYSRRHGKQPGRLKGFNLNKENREPIAIIGLSGRYPQAKGIEVFWDNLAHGKDCITEIPGERWPLEGFYHSNPEEAASMGKSYSKWGGFVEGFAEFDPLFFNISPREAFNMDPQERLFIESCWEVLEDAGYTKEQLAEEYHGRVGVFAGITKTGFDLYGPDLWRQGESIFPHTSFSSVANRVSYLLNLQGPSMPIDTMCSSSLTAIHEACEHLHRGECEMAIAGGVNLYLHPATYMALCGQQMLSRDGQCKSFGKGGNGFVPGEGVGTVLLKPLSRAITDEDQIYAVIRGTSINHGGKTNGYTVPNPKAQGELIRTALEKSGVNARTVSYIEAHGTGTELGDPIEITGLTRAFRKDTADLGYCAIGSVKSNIGHLEAAAGIAGLTKIVLQMKHRQLVPSLHAEELNPNIDFIKTPFIVQQELTEWERPVVTIDGVTKEYPRIAGISSFGAGGSNAHVVIEEYVTENRNAAMPLPVIIVLSARNVDQLKQQARRLLVAIGEFADGNLADIAYTLQTGREAMEERLSLIAHSIAELAEKLRGFTEGREGIDGLYLGQIKRNKEMVSVLTADEEMQETVTKWIQRRKYKKLAELWVKGMSFDWNRLYGEVKPRRISLPAYPFARERYWVPEMKTKRTLAPNMSITTYIHPLLQQNTSVTTAGVSFINIPDKPDRITLQQLSDDRVLAIKPPNQTVSPIKLSPAAVSLHRTGINVQLNPAPALPTTVPVRSLQDSLIASLAEALYMKPSDIDIDKKFVDMGLDSIIGVEWIKSINKEYRVSIPATRVYDYPTIREFAGFLENELHITKPESPVDDQPKREAGIQPMIPLESLQEELAVSLAEVLYMKRSDVDIDKKFIDMGLDSIIGVEWMKLINKHYQISIPATRVYDYPTIREFTEFLAQELIQIRPEALQPDTVLSLDDMLLQVEEGTLDIKEADHLFHQYITGGLK